MPSSQDDLYDEDLFTSVKEENAYIKRQLALLKQLAHGATTEAQWIALKLSIPTRQAQRKIARARGRKPARKKHA